jgi:hypothetical protein
MMANGGGGAPTSAPMMAGASVSDFACLNMTFEEAYESMAAGEPLDAKAMIVAEGPMVISAQAVAFGGVAMTGFPMIGLIGNVNETTITLFWTADGISTQYPGGVS